ncbi:Maf family protein [Nesterenkonia sp. PF2B19]|uniref:Maf family protein n=1 Tax=Nesterenkonia sp. PF2B19 TaxID=1881858 RepID=UPI002351549D|nr:Maf family protein [Nesterenkonia sp. PF2B19]
MSAHHDKTPRLILASASPSRRQILEEAGLDFEVVVSEVDEPAVVASAVEALGPLTPAEEALLLARTKAEDVASRGAARGAWCWAATPSSSSTASPTVSPMR